MSTGIKPTRIEGEGYALPDEVSIDGAYTGDDVDWDSSPGQLGFDQWKQPVRCATTASITIATALNAGDSIDGVTLAAGDRILVKDQGTASENGIYTAGTTPARAADMDDDAEVLGAVVYVIDGTANAGTVWTCINTTAAIVDTDAIDWAQLSVGSGGGVTVADEGTPLSTTATTLDFVGAGVTATGSGATKTITIPGGSGIVVKDEGSTLTTDATTLDFVGSGVVASGTGATKTITIAGGGGGETYTLDAYLAASGSARNDEFNAGPGIDAKWTLVGTTPDDVDENNDHAGILAIRRNDTGSQLSVYYQDLPSFPCDIVVKVRAANNVANYARGGGIVLLPATPTTSSGVRYIGLVYENSKAASSIVYSNFSTFASQVSMGPVSTPSGLWVRVTVLSGGTTADIYWSSDGYLWTLHQAAVSVGFTVANAGIGLAPEGQATDLFGLFDFYRVSA